MSVRNEIQRITERIIERSKGSRGDYLSRMADAVTESRTRARLSRGNLAHAMAACDAEEKAIIAAEKQANLGIISSYNDMLSAHQPYHRYPELIKAAVRELGGTAQVAGMVPAMCDGDSGTGWHGTLIVQP